MESALFDDIQTYTHTQRKTDVGKNKENEEFIGKQEQNKSKGISKLND